MPCELRDDLHYCVVEDRSIFFDLSRGRYFALPSNLESAFDRVRNASAISPVREDDLDRLRRAGILQGTVGDAMSSNRLKQPAAASDRAMAAESTRVRLRSTIQMFLAQLCSTMMLRIFPIGVIMRRLERRAVRRDDLPIDLNIVDELFAASRAAGLLLRTEGQCLPRTLAFVWLCRRKGYAANLVVGVRINPFAAHCWAQSNDVVLNDTIDRTSMFEPIFVA